MNPGEILLYEFMIPNNISQNKLARLIDVPPDRINKIILGKRKITFDTALRLSILFNTTITFWINLQNTCDFINFMNNEYTDLYNSLKDKIRNL